MLYKFIALLISSLTVASITCAQKNTFVDVSASHIPQADLRNNSMDVAIGDIDQDGDNDIVIASEFRPNLILINNGNGKFVNGTSGRLPSKNHDSEDVVLADFDGDKDLDIIFVSEDDQVNEYYVNNGNGYFTDRSDDFPVAGISNAVAAADLDGDGDPDVIIGNEGQDFYLSNDGKGNFKDETASRMPMDLSVTQDVKIIDINADGFADLIMGNEDGNRIYINDGSGHFKNETKDRMPPASGGEETRKVTIGDIDQDGDPDIFLANVNFTGVNSIGNRVLINNGKGFFRDETGDRYKGNNNRHSADAVFEDLDQDKDLDLIIANVFGGQPQIFVNDGRGVMVETSGILPDKVSTECITVIVQDLDGDDIVDVYFGVFRGSDILLQGKRK